MRGLDPEGDITGFASALEVDGGVGALRQGRADVVPLHKLEPVHGGGEIALKSDLQVVLGFVDAGDSVVATPPVTPAETGGRDEEENAGGTQNQLPLENRDAPREGAIGGLGDAVGDAANGVGFRLGDAGLEAVDFGIGSLMAAVERCENALAGLRRDALALGAAPGEEADLLGQRREQRHHRIVALDAGGTCGLPQLGDEGLDILRRVRGDRHRRRTATIGGRRGRPPDQPPGRGAPGSPGHGSHSATGAKAVSMARRQVAICWRFQGPIGA